ncbi:MAG: hypothetical protein IKV32_07330 [Muribaculaceae bacterium]|nr:hypothetical protein [Muribaculaceae bacterium]
MKRFWKIVSIALICGMMSTPQIDARGRNNSGNTRTESRSSQRSSDARPSGNKNASSRKDGNKVNNNAPKPGNNNRPSNNSNVPKPDNIGNNTRPDNNKTPQKPSGTINAPSGSHNGGNQPPHGNNNAPRPGNDHAVRPPQPSHSAPSHNNGPSHHHIDRPHCPPARPYYRPIPPPTFRPHSGCPVLRTIFGISFGTSINLSIDYLNRNGYTVSGYGNDVVYLRNVSQLNYTWHDATLYYDGYGLTGSQFMYSTNYNSITRYNNVYNKLYNQYGAPVSYHSTSTEMTATWWGYDGQYVSLEYRPIYTNNGQLRYFTILSFGR